MAAPQHMEGVGVRFACGPAKFANCRIVAHRRTSSARASTVSGLEVLRLLSPLEEAHSAYDQFDGRDRIIIALMGCTPVT